MTVTPTAAMFNKLTTLTSEASQIDAMVAGPVTTYIKNVTVAQVNTGTTAVVPAVAGKRFQVLGICMRANGGGAATATTVDLMEDGGNIFLSHIVAHLGATVWVNDVAGAGVVRTGMTAGGMTAVANKALLACRTTAGGDLDGCTSVDYKVCGYYTTT